MLLILQAVSYTASILAGIVLFFGMAAANGAPQEAAAAAFAAALAIIPYTLCATAQRNRLISLTKASIDEDE